MFQIKGEEIDMPTKCIPDSKLGRNFTIKNIIGAIENIGIWL